MKSNFKVTRDTELTNLPISFFLNNRKRFIQNLKNSLEGIKEKAILFLKGGENPVRFDNDEDMHFLLQEANFYYLTGVREENVYATIDLSDASFKLFIPTPNETTRIFSHTESLEQLSKKYGCTALELEKINSLIAQSQPEQIFVLNGINSDSNKPIYTCDHVFKQPYAYLNDLIDNNPLVYEILADTRTVKSEEEIECIRFAVDAAIQAHLDCMKLIQPGKTEREVENTFWCKVTELTFCRNHPYEHICASGTNSAVLHYIENEETLKDGDLILNDMGTKLCNYVSDITMTVPVNGKFSSKQKEIYDIVLSANQAIKEQAKPGVSWTDMHLLAEEKILTGLQQLGLLSSEYSVSDMLMDRVGYYFMPHGVGHFIGLECHDVGGYLSFTPERSKELGLSLLRTARVLKKGNVITDEPGIYFIPFLLEQGFKDSKVGKYFVQSKVKEYYNFGGIRIEDDLLITEDGVENLSKALPRTTDDIEQYMKH